MSTKDFGDNNGREIAINFLSSGSAPERNLSPNRGLSNERHRKEKVLK